VNIKVEDIIYSLDVIDIEKATKKPVGSHCNIAANYFKLLSSKIDLKCLLSKIHN